MSRSPHVSALAHIAGRLEARAGDFAPARSIFAEVNRLRNAAEALDTLKANRSPLRTPEAHTKDIADKARKLHAETTASINRIAAAQRDGQRELRSRIEEKVKLKPNEFAPEIRTAFRALSRADQMTLLARLVDENRGPELAAIVNAPAVLTGLHNDEPAKFEQAIIAKHAADEFEAQQTLDEIVEAAFSATKAAGDFTKGLNDPGELARIERAHAAASESGIAFDQALAQQ